MYLHTHVAFGRRHPDWAVSSNAMAAIAGTAGSTVVSTAARAIRGIGWGPGQRSPSLRLLRQRHHSGRVGAGRPEAFRAALA